MNLKIYAVAIGASKQIADGRQFRWGPGAVTAMNEAEATGKALDMCRQLFPPDDGWYGHEAFIVVVPETMIDRVRSAHVN